MNTSAIFIVVYLAMIANSFWEAYAEGRNTWELGKVGWKVKVGKFWFTGYHFFLFWVMWPLLLSLPLIIYGWNVKLFGILISAYFSGLVIQDVFWYIVNPVVKLSEFGSRFSNHYPWIGLKKLKIPVHYLAFILIALASWYFIWR